MTVGIRRGVSEMFLIDDFGETGVEIGIARTKSPTQARRIRDALNARNGIAGLTIRIMRAGELRTFVILAAAPSPAGSAWTMLLRDVLSNVCFAEVVGSFEIVEHTAEPKLAEEIEVEP